MLIPFINRASEISFLENQLSRGNAFLVVYGRRRVGKSELLKHFLKGKKGVYWLATQEIEKELAESFSSDVAVFFQDQTLKINPFSNFKQIMEYLKQKDLNGVTIVIDEFPYLVDANKAIPSILQKYWDEHFKQNGLNLILCGSSISAMENEVLGSKSPLYGRRTGQWKVDPLSFQHFTKFFPNASEEQLVEIYSVTGGVPLYILEFNQQEKTLENAQRVIAARGSLLYQETEFILKEELREPKTYFSLLKEISEGKNTLNELSNALGTPRTTLVSYINTLSELDLIELIKPVTSHKTSKDTRYIVKDNYIKFWFKFIYPFKKELDSGNFENFKKNFNVNFNTYVGRQFEQICRQYITSKNTINARLIDPWWGVKNQKGTREAVEIDAIALNEETNTALFAECKWSENVNAAYEIERLKEKAKHVEWRNEKRTERFVIFAKTFKNNKVKDLKVQLINLKQLIQRMK